VTDVDDLERRYRRWLTWYPTSFRREHEAEILGVLMAIARDGQRHPGPLECLDLMSNGLRMRLRPTLSRSERSASRAVRLLYLGAVLELVAAITILATAGDIRTSEVSRNLRYTDAQWSAVVADQLEPVALAATVAAAVWLGLAWAIGRRHRSARIMLAVFLGVNVYGLFNGLAQGSAMSAQADLAIGTALCLVQLATVVLVFPKEFGRLGRVRVGRRSNRDPSLRTPAP
jgi:hypothetical protein